VLCFISYNTTSITRNNDLQDSSKSLKMVGAEEGEVDRSPSGSFLWVAI
jgi:hypothetical protein